MPDYLIKSWILFFLLSGGTLFAAETGSPFAIPGDRPQVSFAPQSPTPERQLQKVAEGFSSQAHANPAPRLQLTRQPSPQVAQNVSPTSSQIVSATMNSPDSSTTRPASATLATTEPPKQKNSDNTHSIAHPLPESSKGPEPSENEGSTSASLTGDPLDKPISLKGANEKGKMKRPSMSVSIAPLLSIFGSLLIVLSVFLLLVFCLKKVGPKGTRPIPKEVFENLGRTFLTQKLQLHLLRLGNRLILVSVTQDGVSPITEVTDPDEVVHLLGICRRLDANSSTELFQKTLSDLSEEKSPGGFFGTESKPSAKGKQDRGKAKSNSSLDLYDEPTESLAEMLASGFTAKGGTHG